VCLQARVRALAEIVGALVGGVKRGENVDLNAVKRQVSMQLPSVCCALDTQGMATENSYRRQC
jgi:hypothetical protein